jgi:hypothetical protein
MPIVVSQKSHGFGLLSSLIASTLFFTAGCGDDGTVSSDMSTSSDPLFIESIGGVEEAQSNDRGEHRVTSTVGATGEIEIAPDFIQGTFSAGDIILRARAHPECVANITDAEKPLADAGTLTISSDLVGQEGGPPAPFVIQSDSDPFVHNLYVDYPSPVLYNVGEATRTWTKLSGNSNFPAMPKTQVRSPAFASINITAPTVPPSGVLAIQSTAPYKFKWDVPSAPSPHKKTQRVSARLFALSPVKWIQLFCSWPLTDGHGKLPVSLLRAMKEQLAFDAPVDAVVDTYAGEFTEVATATSSYVIFPTNVDSTTLRQVSATFE